MESWLRKSNSARLFYIGSFISSFGNQLFPSTALAFMSMNGFSTLMIGYVMGVARLGSVCGSSVIGGISDKFSPKIVLIVTEAFCLLLTVALMVCWKSVLSLFAPFLCLVFLRFAILYVGTPARSKIAKQLAGAGDDSSFKSGIWVNLVTYGPVLFSSIVGIYAIKNLSFEGVLVIDSATFLLNGVIVWLFIDEPALEIQSERKKYFANPLDGIKKFYTVYRFVSIRDLILNVPFMGTNLLMVRLANGHPERVPVFLLCFGLAIWISSLLVTRKSAKLFQSEVSMWLLLTSSFLLLALFHHVYIIALVGVFLRNIAYWSLSHRIAGIVQRDVSTSELARIVGLRLAISTLILGAGEILFGALAPHLGITSELLLRCGICAVFCFGTWRISSCQ